MKKEHKSETRQTVISDMVHNLGRHIHMVAEFGLESTVADLNGLKPSLLIVLSECTDSYLTYIKGRLKTTEMGIPYIVSEAELLEMGRLFPIELIHIKSDYSLIYGEDRLALLDPEHVHVVVQLERELHSIILQIRSVMSDALCDSNSVGIAVLIRMVPICKALLTLRDALIPISLGTLVSEMESCYSLKQFPLSEMVSALEKAGNAELSEFFLPLHNVLVQLKETVTARGNK